MSFEHLIYPEGKSLMTLNLMVNCSPTLTVIKVKRNASIATEQALIGRVPKKQTLRRFEGGDVDCCLIYIYFIEPLMTVYFLDVL
jgi:hypothetical protein